MGTVEYWKLLSVALRAFKTKVIPVFTDWEIRSVALGAFKSKLVSSVLETWPVIEHLGKAGGPEERRAGKEQEQRKS